MAKGIKTGGGSRLGKRNKTTGELRDILDSTVDFSIVCSKLYELSKGITCKKTEKNGDEVIYEKPPDAFAAKTLLEFRYGKAAQPLTGDSAKPIEVIVRGVS